MGLMQMYNELGDEFQRVPRTESTSHKYARKATEQCTKESRIRVFNCADLYVWIMSSNKWMSLGLRPLTPLVNNKRFGQDWIELNALRADESFASMTPLKIDNSQAAALAGVQVGFHQVGANAADLFEVYCCTGTTMLFVVIRCILHHRLWKATVDN